MLKLRRLLPLFCCLPFWVACDKAEPVALLVQPAKLDLGTIPFGSFNEGSFEIQNQGTSPLRILGIGPSGCDCATMALHLPDRPNSSPIRPEYRGMNLVLQPGERATLDIVLDTSRYREPITWKSGRIPLIVEGHPPVGLDYFADIWTPFWVEPWSIPLGEIGIRSRATASAVVRSQEAEEFTVLTPPDLDGWKIETKRVDTDATCAWELNVTAPPELPEGPFQKNFVLRTDLAGAPPLKFSVRGNVLPDIAHSPSRLLLQPNGQVVSTVLSIRALPDDLFLSLPQFALLDLIPGLEAQLETVQEGKLYRLHIKFSGEAPLETVKTHILIKTGNTETPQLKVPLFLLSKKTKSP